MKSQILLFLLTLSFVGCKEPAEVKLTPAKSMVGTWELVESVGSWTVNGSTSSLNESKTGKRFVFNADGTCTVDNFTNYDVQVKGSILILKEVKKGIEIRSEVTFAVDATTLTLTKNLEQFIGEYTFYDPNANKTISAANLKSTFRRLQGSELTTPVATEVKIGEAKSFQILTFETTGDTLKTNEYVGKISNEDVKLIKVAKNKLSVLVLDTWKDGKVELTIPTLGTTKYSFTKTPTILAGSAESIINQKFDKLIATSFDVKNTQIDKSLANIKTYLAGLNEADKKMVAQFIQNNPDVFSEANIINGRLLATNNYSKRLVKFGGKVLLMGASAATCYLSVKLPPLCVAAGLVALLSLKAAIKEFDNFQKEKDVEISTNLSEADLSLRKNKVVQANELTFQVSEEKTLKGILTVGNLTPSNRSDVAFAGFFKTMDSMFGIIENINAVFEIINTALGKTIIEKVTVAPLTTEANPVNVAMTAEQTKGLTISCPSSLVDMTTSYTNDGKLKVRFSKTPQNLSTNDVPTVIMLTYKSELTSFNRNIEVLVNIENPLFGIWNLTNVIGLHEFKFTEKSLSPNEKCFSSNDFEIRNINKIEDNASYIDVKNQSLLYKTNFPEMKFSPSGYCDFGLIAKYKLDPTKGTINLTDFTNQENQQGDKITEVEFKKQYLLLFKKFCAPYPVNEKFYDNGELNIEMKYKNGKMTCKITLDFKGSHFVQESCQFCTWFDKEKKIDRVECFEKPKWTGSISEKTYGNYHYEITQEFTKQK